MERFLGIVFIFAVTYGCREPKLKTSDIIEIVKFDREDIPADNSSILLITAKLNSNVDQRKVIFETDRGVLLDSPDGSKIIVEAQKINNELIAVAKLRAPGVEGKINITTQPAITDQYGLYTITSSIEAKESFAENIKIKLNSFQVYNNFDSEVVVNGTLTNSAGGAVSNGYHIILEDFYEGTTKPVKGIFREAKLVSNNSQVSAIYSPGVITSNQFVDIVATILDASGNVTKHSDTVKLYVTFKH